MQRFVRAAPCVRDPLLSCCVPSDSKGMARHAKAHAAIVCALLLLLSMPSPGICAAGADELAVPPHPGAMPTVDVKPIDQSWPSGKGGHGPSGKNVLFIASDDMRPEISPYGHKYMHTPNMQSLADDGYTFRRMYVQQALCAPSRTVMLTGRRPDRSRVWDIGPYFRDTTGADWVTLPQAFKQAGYITGGAGKLFHTGAPSGFLQEKDNVTGKEYVVRYGDDYPMSWTLPYNQNVDVMPADGQYPNDTHPKYPAKFPKPAVGGGYTSHGYHVWSNRGIDAPIADFNDARNAMSIVNTITYLSNSTMAAPFFLAQGFHRPHFPYLHPKEFADFYPNDTVSYPPKTGFQITRDVPVMAPHDWTGEGFGAGDLKDLNIVGNMPAGGSREYNWSSMCDAMPYWKGKEMKRSYYACISYVDHMIGWLVGEVKKQQLYADTTIVFWTDHGYKLGEHCDWFKHDNYEDATRIVTIIKPADGLLKNPKPPGTIIEQLAEEVDMYPSLLDLHKMPVPPELQGESWVPLLEKSSVDNSGKQRVFSQYPHGLRANASVHGFKNESGLVMGYSCGSHSCLHQHTEMRTPLWRYTEWAKFDCKPQNPMPCAGVAPQWDHVWGMELYDHKGDEANDFGAYENENLAYRPDHAQIVAQLKQELHEHWPTA